jgi:hypothetical protein
VDVLVHSQGVGLQGRGDSAVLDEVGVADDGAAEVPGADAVDRVGVPDAADVDAVSNAPQQFPVERAIASLRSK